MSKHSPRAHARMLANALTPSLEALIRAAALGLPVGPALADLGDEIRADVADRALNTIVSPHHEISDDEWADAYDDALNGLPEGVEPDDAMVELEINRRMEARQRRRSA